MLEIRSELVLMLLDFEICDAAGIDHRPSPSLLKLERRLGIRNSTIAATGRVAAIGVTRPRKLEAPGAEWPGRPGLRLHRLELGMPVNGAAEPGLARPGRVTGTG